jgi:hypothetical protein
MSSLIFNNQYRTEPYNPPVQAKSISHPKAATELPETAINSQANTVSSPKNPLYGKDFLEKANEALIYQRLGVDIDKIAELKAAIEKLTEKIQEQGGGNDELAKQMESLQKMLGQEYQKGRELQSKTPDHDKGKIISAFV